MPEVVIAVAKLDPSDPRGDHILDELELSPSFGSAGTEDIDGHRGRLVHVGNVESEQTARTVIADSLDDVTPQWREHLRFLDS